MDKGAATQATTADPLDDVTSGAAGIREDDGTGEEPVAAEADAAGNKEEGSAGVAPVAADGGEKLRSPASPQLEENVDSGLIGFSKEDKARAIAIAKQYAKDNMPVVPNKPGKPAYDERAGKSFPLSAPAFHTEKPNLADLSLGLSLYFDLLWRMSIGFFIIAVVCIPSLIITFVAVPSWADSESVFPAALKKFSIGAMVKLSSTGRHMQMHVCSCRRNDLPNLPNVLIMASVLCARLHGHNIVRCRSIWM
jgi:hypothetical protein